MKDNKLQRAVENWSALPYQVCKRQRGFNQMSMTYDVILLHRCIHVVCSYY